MKTKTATFLLSSAGLVAASLVAWVGLLVAQTYAKYNVEAARKAGTGVPVKITEAKIEKLPEVIGASSLAEPTLIIDVKTQISEVVKAVHVHVGQVVSKGDKLIELNSTLLVAAAKTAEDTLAKAETKLKNSRLSWQRTSNLYFEGVVAKVTLEEAALTMREAQSDYTEATEELEVARYNLQRAVILSPIDGVVMGRVGLASDPIEAARPIVNPGETVNANRDSLLSLGELQSLVVLGKVPEEKIDSIHLLQNAEVVFDSYPNVILSGQVEKIDPQVDPETRTFKVYIKLSQHSLTLRPGLSAYSRLQHQRKALTVPRPAVIKNAGEATVFVVENSRARLRAVKTGVEVSGKVEIISGLKKGEQVVYYGLMGLKDNDAINLQAFSAMQ
ncbi:MAG: efflux RND transporter periplasmic adaptor subunit [Gammaproteobacteria bacterium]